MILIMASIVGCVSPASTSPNLASAADLMVGVNSNRVSGKSASDEFIANMADFSIDLFKRSITANKNSLISPLSVTLALAMTANGADNETLSQMEALLGGDIPLDDLNEYLKAYVTALPSLEKSKLSIANSIWFRNENERLSVLPTFLQKNADYYDAAVYSAAFDSQTVKDINNWVSTSTDGMINKILDEISDIHLMFLINAVVFDAEWLHVYDKSNVKDGIFTDVLGNNGIIDFMHSTEYNYLYDDTATGFIKAYAGGAYSFAALLPNYDVPIDIYIESLTGEKFMSIIGNASNETVFTSMPKFEFDYDISMINALSDLGMPDAFKDDKADFSKMAITADDVLYISNVLHKTYISVDELGTRAGAVTMVAMAGTGAALDPKVVNLDRPFVFAIIDNSTNLPIFIGTLMMV